MNYTSAYVKTLSALRSSWVDTFRFTSCESSKSSWWLLNSSRRPMLSARSRNRVHGENRRSMVSAKQRFCRHARNSPHDDLDDGYRQMVVDCCKLQHDYFHCAALIFYAFDEKVSRARFFQVLVCPSPVWFRPPFKTSEICSVFSFQLYIIFVLCLSP
jgi:hypothetical protein